MVLNVIEYWTCMNKKWNKFLQEKQRSKGEQWTTVLCLWCLSHSALRLAQSLHQNCHIIYCLFMSQSWIHAIYHDLSALTSRQRHSGMASSLCILGRGQRSCVLNQSMDCRCFRNVCLKWRDPGSSDGNHDVMDDVSMEITSKYLATNQSGRTSLSWNSIVKFIMWKVSQIL